MNLTNSQKVLRNLAVAALSVLVTSSSRLTAASAPTLTLIDASTGLNNALPSVPNKSIVTLLTSPGTSSPFGNLSTDTLLTTNSDNDNAILITSPGASLESTTPLSRGAHAACAASIASSTILGGVTLSDIECGLGKTRHGRTLSELFAAVIRLSQKEQGNGEESGHGRRRLIVAVQATSSDTNTVDERVVRKEVEEIFQSVADVSCVDDCFGDYFDFEVALVRGKEDASTMLSTTLSSASTAAPILSNKSSFSSVFSTMYNDIINSQTCDPTPVAEAILACNDAYSRASRMSRAKLATWKHRASRGLLVEKFGFHANSLLKNTLDLFDRDTMAAAGLPEAAEKRLEIRSNLLERTEKILRELYAMQIAILEKATIKKFNSALLRNMGKEGRNSEDFYENNADVLRDALFAFESAVTTLEISSLALTKTKPLQTMTDRLNNALMTFTDSPAAKIKAMKKVERTVSKKKKPSEGSIDVALDLVAMIRPDGFGNLQGFAGYQLGPHSVTVGVHNDADDPQVISSFGGVRPPFIRVQPKLKLDVEL